MSHQFSFLMYTAATVGFIHTLFGPDHYLPFIMMTKAGKWTKRKTFWVTFLSGLGHVGSSVVIGLLGIAIGTAVGKLEHVETVRGDMAAYAFLVFGIIYFIWGLRRAYLNKPHTHCHIHANGEVHTHCHTHENEHAHVHEESSAETRKKLLPWIIFTIFVLGPCEPLIPILMYPAVEQSYITLTAVTLVFCLTTVLTMLGVVFLALLGVDFIPLKKAERYSHALAGATIAICGVAIIMGL